MAFCVFRCAEAFGDLGCKLAGSGGALLVPLPPIAAPFPPLLLSSPPLLLSVAAPFAAPLITAVCVSPRRRTSMPIVSSTAAAAALIDAAPLLSRHSSRRRHSSRCHHSSLAALLSSTLFLSSPPTVPRTPFVSNTNPLRLPLLSSTPHLLDPLTLLIRPRLRPRRSHRKMAPHARMCTCLFVSV